MNRCDGVVLHSSWRGIIGGVLGAMVLCALGGVPLLFGRGGIGAPVVAVVGAVLLAVMLWDYPVASHFGSDGIQRRAFLRHHVLCWGEIDELARTRPGMRAAMNWRSGGLSSGGLVAVVGRRRYLLVDQAESRAEYRAVREVMAASEAALLSLPPAPPEDTPPTDLYRRRRWRRSVSGDDTPR
jgi:hypothetical protein